LIILDILCYCRLVCLCHLL